MKKFFFVFAVLPLLVFGDFVPDNFEFRVWSYRYSSSGSFNVPVSYDVSIGTVTASQLSLIYFNTSFGVSITSLGALSYPSLDAAKLNALTNSVKSPYFNLQAVDGSGYYSLVKVCPDVRSYALICSRLFYTGYTGDGISNVSTNSTGYIFFNCLPARVFSDVLNSTNTVFRRVLLDSLSSINSSIQNVVINLEGVQSAIGESNSHLLNINNFSSQIADSSSRSAAYAESIDSNVNNIDSAFSHFVLDYNDFSSNLVYSVKSNGVVLASSTNLLSLVANLLVSSTNGLSDIVSALARNTQAIDTGNYTTHSQLGDLLGAYGEVNFASIDRDSRWVLSHLATDTPLDPSAMPNFGTSSDDRGPRDSQQLRALEELSREDLRRAIDSIRDSDSPYHNKPLSDILNNREARGDISGNYHVTRNFTTNNVVKPITNSVNQAAHDIQTNTTHQIENLFDKMSTDGINVRIIYPEHGKDVEAVHVHDDAFDVVANTFYEATNLLAAIATNHYDWDKFHDWDTNSFQFWQENIYTALTNNIREWLLLTDYEDFVNSKRFESVVNHFKGKNEDYFESLGVELPENGNWWPVVTASFIRQALDINFVASMFTNVQAVIDMANNDGIFGEDEDSNSYNLFTATKKVVGSFPSRTSIDDYISQSTNSANSVLTHTNELVSSFSDITNLFSRSERFFSHGSGLPSSLTLFEIKAPGEGQQPKKFTIDVQEHENVFTLMRYGVATVFTFVNIILLPRFILWVFRLFMRLFRRSLPFVDSQQ